MHFIQWHDSSVHYRTFIHSTLKSIYQFTYHWNSFLKSFCRILASMRSISLHILVSSLSAIDCYWSITTVIETFWANLHPTVYPSSAKMFLSFAAAIELLRVFLRRFKSFTRIRASYSIRRRLYSERSSIVLALKFVSYNSNNASQSENAVVIFWTVALSSPSLVSVDARPYTV